MIYIPQMTRGSYFRSQATSLGNSSQLKFLTSRRAVGALRDLLEGHSSAWQVDDRERSESWGGLAPALLRR